MDDEFDFRRRHIGRAVARALWLFEARMLEGLQARGFDDIRLSDTNVIRCLPVEGGARLVDLAARAGMTKQGMGKQIASMEQRRYVERAPDPDDGRAQRVCLTARGRKLLGTVGELIAEVEDDWQAILGPRALVRLKRDLFKLVDALGPADYL